MEAERSEVEWGTRRIPYAIRRSPRRATVSVAVEPSGAVVLTAPPAVSVARLDGVVRQKAQWIVDRVRQRSELPAPSSREWVSGETILYLGRSYRLRVLSAPRAAPARLERGHLVVATDAPKDRPERAKAVESAVVTWLRSHAERRLPERTEAWAAKLRVGTPTVLVRDQRQRWGSCDASGVLRLNWRIVQAPTSLIDYVVAHELVHLVHREHSPAFWAMLGKAMPDYEERKRRLLELGPQLAR